MTISPGCRAYHVTINLGIFIDCKGQIHRKGTPEYLLILRRTFKFAVSYLDFESSNQDTTASGINPTGVRLRTPSDPRCNSPVADGWSLRRFPASGMQIS